MLTRFVSPFLMSLKQTTTATDSHESSVPTGVSITRLSVCSIASGSGKPGTLQPFNCGWLLKRQPAPANDGDCGRDMGPYKIGHIWWLCHFARNVKI